LTLSWAFVVDSVPFTKAVRDGETSLGGSESACLGLARSLAARGHNVHIVATKLSPDAWGVDAYGVTWIPYEQLETMNRFYEWDVFVGLRMPAVFGTPRNARLKVLWNQDLLNHDGFKKVVMAHAWAFDKNVYVSEYHRAQWEDWLPELKPLGWVTKNGYDPSSIPTDVAKVPYRIIHVSRPERGLQPLLDMWPKIRQVMPQAELHYCRYSSMYDKEGWGAVCRDFDKQAFEVHQKVGGITPLGELAKPALHHAISAAAVMAYPGVSTFAETSCIASIEAQACGTPFLGSWKGALPETCPSGILVPGDAMTESYQNQFINELAWLCREQAKDGRAYRELQARGREHVKAYTYDVIAAEWETWALETFAERYETRRLGVLRQLMHYDDHCAAKLVAQEMIDDADPAAPEAKEALELCDRVIAGIEQNAGHYSERALDPRVELAAVYDRHTEVVQRLKDCTHVVDVACGNGAYAIGLCKADPNVRVTAIDYAPANIEAGRECAIEFGVNDRITWIAMPVWDYERNRMSDEWNAFQAEGRRFDGLWCGEFIEHIHDTPVLIDALESVVTLGSPMVFSCPYGPLSEYRPRDVPHRRGHVHHFGQADLVAVLGKKDAIKFEFMPWANSSPRGEWVGNWFITFRAGTEPTGTRPYWRQIHTTRPKRKLSVGILAHNAQNDLGRCLDSVWSIADEIVVGDAGSIDKTREIAETYDPGMVRVVPVTPVNDHPDGFAGSRNEVLAACTGDAFLWIDVDEILAGSQALWSYLSTGAYRGWALRQNHLHLDAPQHFDKPIRMFLKDPSIQFYGCIHEQPQMGDCNGDIEPALEIQDCQIAHTGYLTLGIRRNKMINRNLPLLLKDQKRFPDRVLGRLLVLRDYVNIADLDCEQHNDQMTTDAERHYAKAIEAFQEFADPAHKYHEIARPFYERALQVLEMGTEIEYSLAGKRGGLAKQTVAKAKRAWIQTPEELTRILTYTTEKAAADMKPKPVRFDPLLPQAELVQTA
jgi:glycosyltransferase involved in cell wall biosynthesis